MTDGQQTPADGTAAEGRRASAPADARCRACGTVEVVDARIADERHQVLTLSGGYGICARPCPQCPWRPENDGVFPAEAFRLSARTAYDLADTTFGCHMTVDGRPLMCAGALLSTGAEHNLVIRMMLITGRFAWDLVSAAGARLHPDYRTMAQANGVASDDPTLTPCR